MPPISTFDSPELLGALEIGAFVSIFMFGTVTMQGHVYYQNCQNEPKWRTYFIALILLLELGHTIVTAQSVWWATITIADMVIKPGNGYATAACTLYSSVITFFVKAYYINSIRVLSSKLWLSILGWILTVIDFGTSLVVSYEAFMDVPREPNNFSFEREWRWLITSGLALGALVDVLIAAAMVYHLRQLSPMLDLQMKRYEKSTLFISAALMIPVDSAAKMLNRLLIWTIGM
ncbi:hypothetical protein J3R30DRAFT_3714403 [Lentinula aciculospora]|uniref:Uncharacterized protein n=1 Tax=Lentinula aciculospora TaxID=153920 RepID=A0A9W8ZWL1_9AGAR|nr:hypothetical protein J3R30DRAFT_3714403 [Lentinula aciculospora]